MTQFSLPANGHISDKWGPRPPLNFHHGWDFGWEYQNTDLRVFAAAPGKVIRVYDTYVMGQCIEINHGDVVSRYCHLADPGIVSVGQVVSRRQHIGTMGNTGTDAHGQRHLHFDVWVGGDSRAGIRVDPAPYFAGTAGTTGTEVPSTKEDDMPRILNIKTIDGQGKADGKIYVDGPGGIRHVDNPDDLSFLQRYIADKPGDVLYQSQLDRVNLYLKPAAAVLDYSKLSDVQKAILDAVALIPTSGGSAVDVQPVLTAISALKFPTADDIAVAVRSKIIAPE